MNSKRDRFSIDELVSISDISNKLLRAAELLKGIDSELSASLNEGYLLLSKLKGDECKNGEIKQSLYCLQTGNYYGDIGEYTGYKDYHVGDIIKFDRYKKNIIIKKNNQYFLYGWVGRSLQSMENDSSIEFERIFKHNEYFKREYSYCHPLSIKNIVS
ncbi:hypothetical protein [Lysinibacillus sp. FSL K6-0102]|uniref:hypothetical protein n=1 Tax=Lysinibacillus sp. FSL K6-0102 TaxID=2975290 RepID=UPI0030FAB9E8